MKKNSKLGFVSKTVLFFNMVAVGLLLLSYLSAIINPSSHWYVAFFGLGYPFFLVTNLLFIVYWLFRKATVSVISIVAILIGYHHLKATVGLRGAMEDTFANDSAQVRLMTYNVHYFKRFGSDLDSVNRDGIFNMIREEQPDIMGFQEFFTRKKGPYNIKDSLKNILKTSHYHFQSSGNEYESTGIAVFSRLPIVESGELDFGGPYSNNGAIWVDVKKGDRKFRVYVVHLASISFQPEDYAYLSRLKKDIETKEEDVVSGKRILKRLKDAFIRRGEQVAILKAHMNECPTPFVVMGDFNDTPVSYTISQLTKNIKNAFAEKGSGFAITYNGEFPNFQIDYILTSQDFQVQSYKVVKKSYSDHYPVRTNVSLAD